MMDDQEFEALAREPLNAAEIRMLIDAELSDSTVTHDDLRLMLAGDLLCDAALEVEAQDTDQPMMKKGSRVRG